MASGNEFNVILGLVKKGFDKGLKDAGGEVDDAAPALGDKMRRHDMTQQKGAADIDLDGLHPDIGI